MLEKVGTPDNILRKSLNAARDIIAETTAIFNETVKIKFEDVDKKIIELIKLYKKNKEI